MMIDTHCHLNQEDYENRDEIIKHMEKNIMIVSGADEKSNREVMELIEKYPNIYGTIGFHPEEAKHVKEQDLNWLKQNLTHPKIVGVGEIGLDYYWDKEEKQKQKELFIKQIEIAKQFSKPIVIHSRDAIIDTYTILKEHLNGTKATMHCYSGSLEMAKQFSKLQIKFGIGGVVTFKNSQKLKEVVKDIPLESILLETDSPYLTPEPFRGSKNEPYNILYIAQKIAEIKGITLEEVLEATTKTAIAQFDLPIKL